MPFLSDAPSGRLIVSMLEVEWMNVGSEISCFEIVFFRSGPLGKPALESAGELTAAANAAGLILAGLGWLDPDKGGVGLEVYGFATGAGRPGVYTFGVSGAEGGPFGILALPPPVF